MNFEKNTYYLNYTNFCSNLIYKFEILLFILMQVHNNIRDLQIFRMIINNLLI